MENTKLIAFANVYATKVKDDKKRPETVECECGGHYLPKNKKKHYQCKNHKLYEEACINDIKRKNK
jgi:hypothetical protein